MATKVKFPKHAVVFVPPTDDSEGGEPIVDGFYGKISEAEKVAELDPNTYACSLTFHPKKKAKKS